MNYIIDAYNLIGKLHCISLQDTDKEERLEAWIQQRLEGRNDKILLIFDGYGDLNLFGSQYKKGAVTSRFTATDETADDYIAWRCSSILNKSTLIVVSSDSKVMSEARSQRIRSISSEEFIASFYPKIKNESAEPTLTDRELDSWIEAFT